MLCSSMSKQPPPPPPPPPPPVLWAPYAWLEMLYDWHKNTPNEEVDKIMNEGLWEGNGRRHPNSDNELKEIM